MSRRVSLANQGYQPGRATSAAEHALQLSTFESAAYDCPASTYVEVGVLACQTSIWIVQALAYLRTLPATFIGVDMDRTAGGYWARKVVPHAEKPGTPTVDFRNCVSWEAASNVPDRSVAWCFIDACHCCACVRKDIQAWAPKIAKKGYLLFHDTGLHWNLGAMHPHPKIGPNLGVLRAIMDSQDDLAPFSVHGIIHGDPPGNDSGMMAFKRFST